MKSYKGVIRTHSFARLTALLTVLALLTSCGMFGSGSNSADSQGDLGQAGQEIIRYTGEKSRIISYVYTAKKDFSLTFNGMGDKQTMERLLDELDKYDIKATFFLPGIRVAEEPDIAKNIISRGHEIENNTLNHLDLTTLEYEQIYKEIKLSNEVIQKETGITPKYIRTKSGDYSDDIRLVAAQLGMEGVVSYNINPKDRDMKSAQEIGDYVARYISRGSIISLNTDINPEVIPSVGLIAKAAEDIGYKLVTLSELVERGGERKPLEQIPGYDAAKINPDYKGTSYELVYKAKTRKKEIALTFDDWATDKTVTQILDILAEYDVKATFFLRAQGVEQNPNLARAMIEEGHDVANHSYAHQVVTTLTPEQLQEDVVKAHQVITEAIQEQPLMLYRPPTGVVDDATAEIIAATGYPRIAMYDVTTLDWDVNNSAEDIVKGIMKKTQSGSVILLHILDGIHTAEALPTVLEKLQDKGYTFVKMKDLIE
ncbi:polysaccharide deacetylase family protein [Paenibacillus fonticola]|uniref:polysaccharide deacetylase family protein n=1 Tax=Paenibacillus fonticola TaxID=379896 RepID=UPI00036BFA01|nr:polysaccharide deacetylase family protein [Paenibacillus fonticola]